MDAEDFVVLKFWGRNNILGNQMLDRIYWTKEAADKRAARMQKRHNWIWAVVAVRVPVETTRRTILSQPAEGGIVGEE